MFTLGIFFFFLETGYLIEPEAHCLSWTGLASKFQGSLCLFVPSAGITGMLPQLHILDVGAGDRAQTFILYNKHFID